MCIVDSENLQKNAQWIEIISISHTFDRIVNRSLNDQIKAHHIPTHLFHMFPFVIQNV